MIYLKNHLSSFCKLIIYAAIFSSSLVFAGVRDDLYETGVNAYIEGDYVAALKNLHSFYILNEDDIKANVDFKNKIERMITSSETILKLAYSSNSLIGKSDFGVRALSPQFRGRFSGNGREIEDLFNNGTIDLQAIEKLNHKVIVMPTSER